MADYKGKSRQIKDALKTYVESIQLNDESAFYLVTDSTDDEFDGSPVCQILPGDYTTTKAAFSQNDRAVAFIFRTHLRLESTGVSSAVYDYMYDLTDLLLDAFDFADANNTLEVIDPAIGTYILNATRGDWIVSGSEEGGLLMCDINVEAKYSKDL